MLKTNEEKDYFHDLFTESILRKEKIIASDILTQSISLLFISQCSYDDDVRKPADVTFHS